MWNPHLNRRCLAATFRRTTNARIICAPDSHRLQTGGMIPSFRAVSSSGDTITDQTLRGHVVFIDFWGGSCFTCGVSATRGREVLVLTGINLPTLLDYLHNRDRYPVVELAERLRQKGQESFRLQRAPAA